jgi:hypothetical protein
MSEKAPVDADRHDNAEPAKPTSDMQKYRCVVGHLICESLGYFTPRSALQALMAHRDGEEYPCEWYSHIAMCQGKGMFDHDALLEINRETIRRAFHLRNRHTGYMAHYPQAKALVDREIEREGSTHGMLASWF